MLRNKWLVKLLISFILLAYQGVFATAAELDSAKICNSDSCGSTTLKSYQIEAAKFEHGISHNVLNTYNLDNEEIVLTQNRKPGFGGFWFLGSKANDKTIVLEVTGGERTRLTGVTRVEGEKTKLIIVNPQGITCDGCSFANVSEVELRTDRVNEITQGQISWNKNLTGDVSIGKNGIVTQDGSLILDTGKIDISGSVTSAGTFKVVSHLNEDQLIGSVADAINLSSAGPIAADKIYLLTTGNGSGMKIVTPLTSRGDLTITAKGDINLAATLYATDNLQISGKNVSIVNLKLPGEAAQLEAGKIIDIKGDKVDLQDGIRLKSGSGFLTVTGKEVVGSGNLVSNNAISVLSLGALTLNSANAEGDISLTAKTHVTVSNLDANQKGNIRVGGEKLVIQEAKGAKKLTMYTSEVANNPKLSGVDNLEIIGLYDKDQADKLKDYNLASPLELSGDLKFVGRNFKNTSNLKAKNIILELTGDFTNEGQGTITTSGDLKLATRNFVNRNRIEVGKCFQVNGDTFINDKQGSISAGSIEIYLWGKMQNGKVFFQGDDSILESKTGGINLIAPEGGVYFGYKKVPDGSGFYLVGSKLLSHNGDIYLQSGEEIIFDGTQTLGNVIAESKKTVKANVVEDKYFIIKKVFDYTEKWCKLFRFFGCVGGPKYRDHYKEISEPVPVILCPVFIGEKFYSNKVDLVFAKPKPITDSDPNGVATDFLSQMAKQHEGMAASGNGADLLTEFAQQTNNLQQSI